MCRNLWPVWWSTHWAVQETHVCNICLFWLALLVYCYSSNAASFVSCAVYRVKDDRDVLHSSPRLKRACVRQVVLDKWFPPVIDNTIVDKLRSPRLRLLLCGRRDAPRHPQRLRQGLRDRSLSTHILNRHNDVNVL